jgi:hypothetical protein
MRLSSAVLAGALAAGAAVAAAPAADKPAATTPHRKALDAPITLRIDKQPLDAAIEMLRETTEVHIVLDALTIQQTLGWAPNAPPTLVDVDLKNVKLKTALRTVLRPYGLSYASLGDGVVVTTEDAATARQMRQSIDVDFDGVEFAAVLKRLSDDTNVHLLLDDRVGDRAKTKVSLELENVPLEAAVRLLAESAGLKPVRMGNVLFVTDKKTAAELRSDPDLAPPTAAPLLGTEW